MYKVVAAAIIGFSFFSTAFATRAWQNADGQLIEAELVRVEASDAILRMHGRIYRVPVSELSQADRDYLETWQKARETASGTVGSSADNAAQVSRPSPGKKGYCLSLRRYPDWRERLQTLNVDWFYNWTARLPDSIPEGIEFVPMVTGGRSNVMRALERVRLMEGATSPYVLTHNEPDSKKQADRTVAEVLEEWPSLMRLEQPLVSPGTVNAMNEWMQAFMEGIEVRDYRVDFIAVHSYGGSNPQAFLNSLDRIHEKYERPIWITEFGVGDWQAGDPSENRHSPESVLEFMRVVLPELEKRDYIYRYAWFAATVDNPALTSSALFHEDGTLTELGEFYAKFR